jgi:hypothetical protein
MLSGALTGAAGPLQLHLEPEMRAREPQLFIETVGAVPGFVRCRLDQGASLFAAMGNGPGDHRLADAFAAVRA